LGVLLSGVGNALPSLARATTFHRSKPATARRFDGEVRR
jgi:hypothetical protein